MSNILDVISAGVAVVIVQQDELCKWRLTGPVLGCSLNAQRQDITISPKYNVFKHIV